MRRARHGRLAAALTAGAATLLAIAFVLLRPSSEPAVALRVVGPEEIVFDWSRDACEPIDIPDTPARAFRDARGRVQVLATHYVARRLVGPDLDHLRRDCRVVFRSHEDPDPRRFDDREWLAGIATEDGRTVHALLHVEYQGDRHPGRCAAGTYRACWFNTLTQALSTDGGESYRHAAPPRQLVASAPYRYEPGAGPVGVFGPRLVRDPRDGVHYALFRTERYGAMQAGVSVMRSERIADPRAWRAWDGWSFAVAFVDPYRNAGLEPQRHVPHPVARASLHEMASSITWNRSLGRWLLLGLAGGPPRRGRRDAPARSAPGVYFALSDDLVRWTPRQRVLAADTIWTAGERGEPIAYPSAIDPDSPARDFSITDRQFHLYFTRFHPRTPGAAGFDRDLVRVPVALSLAGDRAPRAGG